MRVRRHCAGPRGKLALLLVPLWFVSAAPLLAQGEAEFVAWARTHALPLETVEPGGDLTGLSVLGDLVGSARVVGLGEPAHGLHEPLAFRNRVFQYLVEELGFTAIALESGLTESRRLHDFVESGAHGSREALGGGMTWGFGNLKANLELIEWMREYNASADPGRQIQLYGFDISPVHVPVQAALEYLGRVDPESAEDFAERLAARVALSMADRYAPPSLADQDATTRALDDMLTLFDRERPAFVHATSEDEYGWGRRYAIAALQADRFVRLGPSPEEIESAGGIPPNAGAAIGSREVSMEENLRWVLEQEGPEGRVLVFAHNGHIMNGRERGGIWSVLEEPPYMFGTHLRTSLGNDLFTIGVSSDGGPSSSQDESATVDGALARVGHPIFLLPLNPDGTEAGAIRWLDAEQSLRANLQTFILLRPRSAFDALLYVRELGSAELLGRPEG